MDKQDYDYIKSCLEHTYAHHKLPHEADMVWYVNHETQLSVARILDSECYFPNTEDVIYFFEKPWKYEREMQEIIETYAKEYDENYKEDEEEENANDQ
jgi:hypothetical protein